MSKLNKLQLNFILLKEFCRDNFKLIMVILFVLALLTARLVYDIGAKWEDIDQAKTGTVVDNKYYALRFSSYFLCKVKLNDTQQVDAYCFNDCKIGQQVKFRRLVTAFGTEQYTVLSCAINE